MNKIKRERMENFEQICMKMEKEGYTKHSGVISVIKANLMAFVLGFPPIIIGFVIYVLIYGDGISGQVAPLNLLLFFALILLTMVIHELLHGLGWSMFCKQGIKSIQFGVIWKFLTPYCHCKELLTFRQYLIGGLMPFFVLGMGSYIIALIIGSEFWLFLGFFNILAAGGDLTIMLHLLKFRNALFIDHPTECGFIAFTK